MGREGFCRWRRNSTGERRYQGDAVSAVLLGEVERITGLGNELPLIEGRLRVACDANADGEAPRFSAEQLLKLMPYRFSALGVVFPLAFVEDEYKGVSVIAGEKLVLLQEALEKAGKEVENPLAFTGSALIAEVPEMIDINNEKSERPVAIHEGPAGTFDAMLHIGAAAYLKYAPGSLKVPAGGVPVLRMLRKLVIHLPHPFYIYTDHQ